MLRFVFLSSFFSFRPSNLASFHYRLEDYDAVYWNHNTLLRWLPWQPEFISDILFNPAAFSVRY